MSKISAQLQVSAEAKAFPRDAAANVVDDVSRAHFRGRRVYT